MNLNDEEKVAVIERELMIKFGLSYTELQEIPLRTINLWNRIHKKQVAEMRFEEMRRKHG